MKRTNFTLAIVTLINNAYADMSMPPLRMRLNTDLIRTIF